MDDNFAPALLACKASNRLCRLARPRTSKNTKNTKFSLTTDDTDYTDCFSDDHPSQDCFAKQRFIFFEALLQASLQDASNNRNSSSEKPFLTAQPISSFSVFRCLNSIRVIRVQNNTIRFFVSFDVEIIICGICGICVTKNSIKYV